MENRSEVQFRRNRKCQELYTDSTVEYLLPDYEGDVRKILSSSATVRPSGHFLGDGEIEYSGIVVYEIVYLDGEGELSHTTFTSDYDLTEKCQTEGVSEAYANTRVANFAIRLLGPRKISAKATVAAVPHLIEERRHAVEGDGLSGEGLEVLTRVANFRDTRQSEAVEREYAEQLCRLEGAIADEVDIIGLAAIPEVDGVTVRDGEIELVGGLRVGAVVKNGEEAAYREERRIPMEIVVPLPDGFIPETAMPRVTVTSLRSAVNADDSGADVVVNAIVEVVFICDKNNPTELVVDAYLTDADTENGYKDLSYTELIGGARRRENFSLEIPREGDELSALREVIMLEATPRVESVTVEGGRAVASGSLRLSGVASYSCDGGAISYCSIRHDAPFSMPLELGCMLVGNESLETEVRCCLPSVTVDPSRLIVSLPLEISTVATAERSMRVLSEMTVTEREPQRPSSSVVTVYYPTEDDSLFEVAKRFRTTPARLAADNGLTVQSAATGDLDSLAGTERLLILW